jgi:hypothetical protein
VSCTIAGRDLSGGGAAVRSEDRLGLPEYDEYGSLEPPPLDDEEAGLSLYTISVDIGMTPVAFRGEEAENMEECR